MRSASLLLYLSLSAPAALGAGAANAAGAPGSAGPPGPFPNYLQLHSRTRGFQLGRPQKAVVTPDGRSVLFLRATAESPELCLYEFDVQSGKTRELLTPAQLLQGAAEQLSAEEKARRERMRQTLRGFTGFEVSPDGSFLLIPLSGKLYTYSRKTGEVSELRPAAEPAPQPREARGERAGERAPESAPGSARESAPGSARESAPGSAREARGGGEAHSALPSEGARESAPLKKAHSALPSEGARESAPLFDPQLSPDGRLIAYVRGRDLYVMDIVSRRERQLTHSADPDITYGLAEFVAQEELHRFSGFWFSPDSQSLAFAEVDNRPVETLYVTDVLRPELPPQPMRYPRAGQKNAVVRLAVLSLKGGAKERPVYVEWPAERFPYLATVVWQAGGPLLLTVLSRDQRDLELYAAEAPSFRTSRLLSEHDDTWVNIDQDVPRVLRDGSGFLWTSERSGGPELELRDLSGKLVRTLVTREQGFRKLYDIDLEPGQGQGTVTYAASAEPSEQQIYRVPLLGGPPVPLTQGPGYHVAMFGKSHSVYVRQSLSLGAWPRTQVLRLSPGGGPSGPSEQPAGELPSVAMQPPFLPKVEILQVGGQAYRAAIVRPRHFQPGQGKKYPVIVDIYGGPHHNQVMSVASRYLLDQWLADHGYIVFLADGRGTPFRGTAWERAIYGSFGDVPLDDQIEALTAAAERHPEMDLKRVGVFGWSFGGYMAALAVLRRPDIFLAGVAGAPVVDWRDYDTCYTERYLGLPSENRDSYDRGSLLTYAKDLRRPLLILHGTADDNVLFVHSLKLSNALFRAGKPHELLPLPGLTHMVPDPLVTERMWTRIINFLSTALR